MILTEQQKTCDHHFGESGEHQLCTKCGLDRDIARLVGKAVHRDWLRTVHEKKS